VQKNPALRPEQRATVAVGRASDGEAWRLAPQWIRLALASSLGRDDILWTSSRVKTLLSAGRLTPGAIALSVIVEIEEPSACIAKPS